MPTGYILSESDRAILSEVISDFKRRQRNTVNRPAVKPVIHPAPEVYVARTPLGGIPPLTEETGTGWQDHPGAVECDVYQIVANFQGDPTLIDMGFTQTVHNLNEERIGGNRWITIKRDKYGFWIADYPFPHPELTETGTGTGLDLTGTGLPVETCIPCLFQITTHSEPDASTGTGTAAGADYTLQTSDLGTIVQLDTSTSFLLDVPTPGGADFPNGWWVLIDNVGTADAILVPDSGTIDGLPWLTLHAGDGILLYTDGVNWWVFNVGTSGVPCGPVMPAVTGLYTGNATDTTIDVSYSLPSGSASASIWYGTSANGPWTLATSNAPAANNGSGTDVTDSGYTVTGLLPSSTYYFMVAANNQCNTPGVSAVTFGTTTATPPPTPGTDCASAPTLTLGTPYTYDIAAGETQVFIANITALADYHVDVAVNSGTFSSFISAGSVVLYTGDDCGSLTLAATNIPPCCIDDTFPASGFLVVEIHAAGDSAANYTITIDEGVC